MKLLIVCGPTATGKTAVALKLAKKFNGELISADSRQLYKGLDALTGKERSSEVPIWLYDIIDIDQSFSAHEFKKLATDAIADIGKRGKLPIVVGGTGFYLKALTEPIETLTIAPNKDMRKQLERLSLGGLQEKLKDVDEGRWERMNDSDRKNPRRLVRAIEVAGAKKGNSLQQGVSLHNTSLWIGLTTTPRVLKKHIEARVADRFDQALTETTEDTAFLLGGPPVLAYKEGNISKTEALRIWAAKEYQYAKRQLTWFKKQKGIHWFDIQDASFSQQVEALVCEWYTKV